MPADGEDGGSDEATLLAVPDDAKHMLALLRLRRARQDGRRYRHLAGASAMGRMAGSGGIGTVATASTNPRVGNLNQRAKKKWRFQKGKIGCVALKGDDFMKIPLKKFAPVKYH